MRYLEDDFNMYILQEEKENFIEECYECKYWDSYSHECLRGICIYNSAIVEK